MGKIISELIEKTGAKDTDVLLIEDGTSTNKITKANLLKEVTQNIGSSSENLQGSYITTTGTKEGSITNLELLGNTIQSSTNLADIQSVGAKQEDGRYKMSILSCGKNLNSETKVGSLSTISGNETVDDAKLRSGFIRVHKGVTYTLSIDGVAKPFIKNKYDMNKNFLSKISDGDLSTFTSDFDGYIRVTRNKDGNNVQCEQSNQATTYEPYQVNKTSILLPCPLEKVGDVSDRLFRREDGVWCIEKNIETKVITGSEGFYNMNRDSANTSAIQTPSNFMKGVSNTSIGVICNGLTSLNANTLYATDTDIEGIAINNNGNLQIRLKKTRLEGTNYVEVLKQAKYMIKGIYLTPQIIELPLEQQISLNSFNGVTNIFTEDTIIEPTIKATVPKSLGASVNSLVNKTDILSQRVEAVEKLKEGSELEVSTDNGYVVCENSNNGQIEELKIEGKTLVNLVDYTNNLANVGSSTCNFSKNNGYYKFEVTKEGSVFSSIKTTTDISNKEVTLIIDNKSSYSPSLYKKNGFTPLKIDIPTGINIIKINTDNLSEGVGLGSLSSRSIGTILEYSVIILEGDHTQNPPSYFEGLKSVGDTSDKIEVLSRKEDGNLINKEKANYSVRVSTATGEEVSDTKYVTTEYIPIASNTKYISDKLPVVIFFDGNKKIISAIDNYTLPCTFTTPTNCRFVRLRNWTQITSQSELESLIQNSTLMKTSSTKATELKSNKKQILFKNSSGTYEKPILRSTGSVSDTIEKHSDGKYYFHKRCGEVTFKGEENWITYPTWDTTNTIAFYLQYESYKLLNVPPAYMAYTECISNLFSYAPRTDFVNLVNKEKIVMYGGKTGVDINISTCSPQININKAKLSSQDVTGFKTWLKSNPLTVVYQLATEEIYECVNLDLDSYEGETSIIFDGGVISPKLTFKIASHIANTVQVLKDRINYLENKVMDMFKAVLCGDVQTLAYELYPEDFPQEDNQQATLEEPPIVDETIEGTELL